MFFAFTPITPTLMTPTAITLRCHYCFSAFDAAIEDIAAIDAFRRYAAADY
jgi:hypothetical protein